MSRTPKLLKEILPNLVTEVYIIIQSATLSDYIFKNLIWFCGLLFVFVVVLGIFKCLLCPVLKTLTLMNYFLPLRCSHVVVPTAHREYNNIWRDLPRLCPSHIQLEPCLWQLQEAHGLRVVTLGGGNSWI